MNIRNFCIIAHIDHGKSTLADRFLVITKTVDKLRNAQMLDTMDLEQERGITIKLTPARMQWKGYELNLIDTPWHVDFQYEVSRSLAAVEGAVLLVDASQGIQAQTLSTLYMAMENNLTIIPVLNKIDLPAADVPRVTRELEQTIGIDPSEIIAISAKTGENIEKVLDAVIDRIQDPKTFKTNNPQRYRNLNTSLSKADEGIISRALIFDSVFDQYKGVVAYVKVIDGAFYPEEDVQLIHSHKTLAPNEVGHFSPQYVKDKAIKEGQIGYILTGQKSVRDAKIGDTIVKIDNEQLKTKIHKSENPNQYMRTYIIPGFKTVKPFVFAGVYPIETDLYDKLKSSFEKLTLNDSAVSRDYEQSLAMWHGFRCGFLGMLHMDIIKERLSREFGMETIFTTPTVTYLIKTKSLKDERITWGTNIRELISSGLFIYVIDEETRTMLQNEEEDKRTEEELIIMLADQLRPWLVVKSGAEMPEQGLIDEIWEPIVEVEIVGPESFSGNIMGLAQEYRGSMTGMEFLDKERVVRKYLMPMGEIVIDFYDRLKSLTKGYATMNYEFKTYKAADLVRLDLWINHDKVEAFSLVVHQDNAYTAGKNLVEKLKVLIPKHMFSIPLQAGIWTKMIARETISAMSKDVIAKCYGGDVSRKKKLLKKQKEGKKKMKMMGRVSVPGDVFVKMVSR